VLGFIDVDGLKGVNDSQGHAAGDAFLQVVGSTLRASVRSYDLIVRVGGDEFVCAMPNTTLAAARQRLEQIIPALSAARGRGSVSFGVAELEPGDDAQTLIARADAALLAVRRTRPNAA
jgi:diguanylate cyclase (GGDEF)-like protein